ncbi:hypothetical protein ATKI12_5074 [Kitasatospora sp. Ki12]
MGLPRSTALTAQEGVRAKTDLERPLERRPGLGAVGVTSGQV